ncbi:EF-P beta-lysylation protein EpmB [Candidatus Fukatsuia anoeciicola]|uniref:EF-P beta-lysylation protein EpmB n=1 Tax=Candidatus Fukatsuia anoeciicola TaxID=2994492 RepID=UPI003463E0A1
MTHIITLNTSTKEDWLQQLSDSITNPNELLHLLELNKHSDLLQGCNARSLFPLHVPRAFVARMEIGNAKDPLLLQVLTIQEEFIAVSGFTSDPLKEQSTIIPGLLHKYHNRVLLLVKGGCAINCRYCFRRHFPYQNNQGNKKNWHQSLQYIRQHTELDEIIFSGGDPLMAKDYELNWLITELEKIKHIKRLRIHTRLPVVIPARITKALCQQFSNSSLQILMVTHINHANEINQPLYDSMAQLKYAGVTLLNQSVLLRGVNDTVIALVELSNALFNAGILPYYIHLLDKVQGAAHFMVDNNKAQYLMKELLSRVSGYLVPRFVRETSGAISKIPLELKLM